MYTNTTHPEVMKSICKYFVLLEDVYLQAQAAHIDRRYVEPEFQSEILQDAIQFLRSKSYTKSPKNYVLMGVKTSPIFVSASDILKSR